jgi:hypothetical protein
VIPRAPAALARSPKRQPQTVAAGAAPTGPWRRVLPTAAAIVFGRIVVIGA